MMGNSVSWSRNVVGGRQLGYRRGGLLLVVFLGWRRRGGRPRTVLRDRKVKRNNRYVGRKYIFLTSSTYYLTDDSNDN